MGLRKKIKRELIGTPDYPSNQIFTISNFITVLRLILTFVFLYLFVMDVNRYVALVIYAVEIIVACVQAYVFALLSAVYVQIAESDEE